MDLGGNEAPRAEEPWNHRNLGNHRNLEDSSDSVISKNFHLCHIIRDILAARVDRIFTNYQTIGKEINLSKYLKISSNLHKEICKAGIEALLATVGKQIETDNRDLALARRELDFHISMRGQEEDQEKIQAGILKSICQQYKANEKASKGFDILGQVTQEELEAGKDRSIAKSLASGRISIPIEQTGMEENPLEILAQTQPAVSQEFNDIMANLALQLKSQSQSQSESQEEKK